MDFVCSAEQRVNKADRSNSGDNDKEEAKLFNSTFQGLYNLFEIEQEEFTHSNANAWSKIDRVYMNYGLHEQLDRHIDCHVHPRTCWSHHKALSFSKTACDNSHRGDNIISSAVYKHPDFRRLVLVEMHQMMEDDTLDMSAVRKLILLKRSMHKVSATLNKQMKLRKAESAADKVEWTMKFIRAAERQSMPKMRKCCTVCPDILELCDPEDPETRSREGFVKLKEKVITMARGEIMEDMEKVQKSEHAEQPRQKEDILKKLKKLILGASAELSAIQREDGTVTSDPCEMANALRQHWQKVFKRKWLDRGVLEEWLNDLQMAQGTSRGAEGDPADTAGSSQSTEEFPCSHDVPLSRRRRARCKLSQNFTDWKVTRRDIRDAIKNSNNSSPGPDAIPFGAWRAMGDVGVEILWNVYEISEDARAEEIFNSAYQDEAEVGHHNFNLSTLVCLPKDPTGEDPQVGTYFAPKATRPLSIVNCDNRLIASAMRIRWENQFKGFIRERQQGFLKNRSMIRNLLEVDTAMLCSALTHENSATIFLDFEAAFPSITQEYTFEALSSCGVPEQAMNSFKFFYRQSRCRIAVKGQTYNGFDPEAGVRQGCPLSPIVYAMVAEILLDRLEQQVGGIFVRAYADDTALIV